MAISSVCSLLLLASAFQVGICVPLQSSPTAGEVVDRQTASLYPGTVPGDHIPHWDEAPSSLGDYPLRRNRTVINPWVYTDRLGLYKILLLATSKDPTLGRANNTANILWGLPLQLGWQFRTGRLRDFSDGDNCNESAVSSVRKGEPTSWNCISPFSWWASMNYYLSVVPFLGAVKAGVFSHWPHELEISASPYRPEDYCTGVEDCSNRFPATMNNWVDLFKTLKYCWRLSNSQNQNTSCRGTDSDSSPPTPPPTLSPREDGIVTKLWKAHTGSLATAQPLFDASRLLLMPEPEQQFGLSWANLIGYIAAANFITDLNTTVAFQTKYLPSRVLHQGDKPPWIRDFSRDVNLALLVIETAFDVDQKTGDLLQHSWEALMCSPASQARGRYLIAHLLQSSFLSLRNFVYLLWIYFTECGGSLI